MQPTGKTRLKAFKIIFPWALPQSASTFDQPGTDPRTEGPGASLARDLQPGYSNDLLHIKKM
jgi:hypothetical protein